MNKDKQRIAIAEACGWKREFNGDHEEPEWFWIPPNDPDGNGEPPNYPNDLNAMHEAEKVLWLTHKWNCYKQHLRRICERDKDSFGYFDRVRATAAQRAEAFLRTLNLWTDDDE